VLTANFVGAGAIFQTLGVFGDLSLVIASSLGAAAVLAGCRRTPFSEIVRYQCISIHAKNFQNG
jgi:hypothetical protein